MKRNVPLKRNVGLKRGSPLKKVSKTQAKRLKSYSEQAKRFLEENPICVVTGQMATQVHHAWGRGPYLLDESTWLAVSLEGHAFIHEHPNQARAKGWLK